MLGKGWKREIVGLVPRGNSANITHWLRVVYALMLLLHVFWRLSAAAPSGSPSAVLEPSLDSIAVDTTTERAAIPYPVVNVGVDQDNDHTNCPVHTRAEWMRQVLALEGSPILLFSGVLSSFLPCFGPGFPGLLSRVWGCLGMTPHRLIEHSLPAKLTAVEQPVGGQNLAMLRGPWSSQHRGHR